MEVLKQARDAIRDLLDIYISAADKCHSDGDVDGYDYYLRRTHESMSEYYRIQKDIDILERKINYEEKIIY